MHANAIDKELYERDLKEEAFEEGYDEGAYQKLKSLVEKKINKGLTVEEIADLLEEEIPLIDKIVNEINERA